MYIRFPSLISPQPVQSITMDSFLTGAQLVLSPRKVVPTYSGSGMQVLRTNDNATTNIGFSGNDFDAASFDSFVTTNQAVVTNLYDQTGNSRHHGQTTPNNRPVLKNGSGKIIVNGRQAMSFNGVTHSLICPTVIGNPGTNGVVTMITVFRKGNNNFATLYNQGVSGAYWNYGLCVDTGIRFRNTNNDWPYGGSNTVSNGTLHCFISISNGAVSQGFLNGVSLGTVSQGTAPSSGGTSYSEIGKRAGDTGEYFTGEFVEHYVLTRAISTQERAFIENNIRAYYSTP